MKCAGARACVRKAKGKARGPEENVIGRKQELASAARVAIAAALGQELCDVEAARAGQHRVGRAAAWQKCDAWDVRRQEVAREVLRRRAAAECSSGRRRAAWRGKGKPARGPVSDGASGEAARGSD
jgi:hypothetical protein